MNLDLTKYTDEQIEAVTEFLWESDTDFLIEAILELMSNEHFDNILSYIEGDEDDVHEPL